jgi:MinD-like ATPase involved in chromosome partitioning or flagellar assembly
MMDSEPGRSGNRHGRVVTFYSYKGGTGRTMTLANVAWILAANGARVLTVDWDLEAPGLSRFFHPFLDHNQLATTGGVVNMINDYLERAVEDATHKHAMESGHAAVSQQAISLDWEFPGEGCIDFISAGRQNEDYSTILNGLNWDQFYQDYEGGTFLDALREEMARGCR